MPPEYILLYGYQFPLHGIIYRRRTMSITPVTGNNFWSSGSTKKATPAATGFAEQLDAAERSKTAATGNSDAAPAVPSMADWIERARQFYAGQTEDEKTPYFIPRTTALPEGVVPVESDADPEYFQGRKVVGYMDGLPVTQETPEEEAAAVAELTEKMLARGQKADEMVFVKANKPIFQEPVGPLLGHHVVTAVMITQPLVPVTDPAVLAQLRSALQNLPEHPAGA